MRGGIQENGPAVEQVGEFSVVTNSFNAEYGRTGSWFTNITIRSGTNQIHGSAFDFFDNDALNARSFFQQIRSTVRHNEGGFTLGAPVYLPEDLQRPQQDLLLFRTAVGLLHQHQQRQPVHRAARRLPLRRFQPAAGLHQYARFPIFDPRTTQPDGKGGFMRDAVSRATAFPPTASARCRRQIVALIPQPDLATARKSTISATARAPEPIATTFPPSSSITVFRTPIRSRSPSAISTTRASSPGKGYGVDSPLEGSQSPKYDSRPHRPHQLRLDRRGRTSSATSPSAWTATTTRRNS